MNLGFGHTVGGQNPAPLETIKNLYFLVFTGGIESFQESQDVSTAL